MTFWDKNLNSKRIRTKTEKQKNRKTEKQKHRKSEKETKRRKKKEEKHDLLPAVYHKNEPIFRSFI